MLRDIRAAVAAVLATALLLLTLASCSGKDAGPAKTAATPAKAAATAPAAGTPGQAAPGAGAGVEAAKKLFREKGCVACHTVTGVPGATGVVGPALDGLASRAELKAGLPVTPENIARWIKAPASIKSDTVMPNLGLTQSEVDTLVAWLMTLK